MKPIYDNENMVWPKLWPVVGNHEVQHRKDEDNFRKLFPDVFSNGPDDEKGLSYSFDYENTHFAIINTDRWYYGNPLDTTDDRRDWHYIKHMEWLENDLKNALVRGMKHTFVFSHEMAYPIGGHLRDGLPNLGRKFLVPLDSTRQWYLNRRNKFLQILKDNDVDAHVCGHEHIYGRQSVNGIYQIITGSAGAPLYQFNPVYRVDADSLYPGEEMSYQDAIPHYNILNYHFGPGLNSQASKDFVGIRAFNYTVFDVQEDFVIVKTYGVYPKENSNTEMKGDIEQIDGFVIFKPEFFSRVNIIK
jgi:hypothetical protein